MLFYFITWPMGRQHMLHWSLNFLFLSFVLCNIKLSNLCNYYFFYLKLKIKSMSINDNERNSIYSAGKTNSQMDEKLTLP